MPERIVKVKIMVQEKISRNDVFLQLYVVIDPEVHTLIVGKMQKESQHHRPKADCRVGNRKDRVQNPLIFLNHIDSPIKII